MKTLKKLNRKIGKTNKAVQLFLKQTYKNYKCMTKKVKSYWLMLFAIICLTACGSTKVSVTKPAEGTSTTITVTTNNPITTNVEPETNATLWDKK